MKHHDDFSESCVTEYYYLQNKFTGDTFNDINGQMMVWTSKKAAKAVADKKEWKVKRCPLEMRSYQADK